MFRPAGAVPIIPPDGRGLNPLLRHPGMIIHPPMLYLGFVSFVIPFAFAIAALVTGRTDDRWIRLTRRWTLVAWLFLSLGLVLGARWAYDVLGWGGYWGWDPVEIAAFMPWLTGTAFLHSVMIQEKRGLFKRWNMILIILTYSPGDLWHLPHPLGRAFLGACLCAKRDRPAVLRLSSALTFVISLGLLLWRWNDLRAEGQMNSLLSRESLFLFNNLLFMGILVVCFWGVIFPLISELFTGQKVTVGPPFYERATGPLFAGLLLLDGHCAAFGLGPFHLQDAGPGACGSRCIVLWWLCWLVYWSLGVRSIPARWSGLLAGGLCRRRSPCMSTAGRFGRAPGRTGESLLTALVAAGRAQPPPLRRLYHPPGRGVDGAGRDRHRDVPDRNAGHACSQGEIADRWAVTPSPTVKLAEFDTADGRNVARAVVDVSETASRSGQLYPRRDYYYDVAAADDHPRRAQHDGR